MARQNGVITRQQAHGCDMTRSMIGTCLRTGAWELLFPDVYAQPDLSGKWLTRISAAALGSGESSAASHRSAARLIGLDGFKENLVEVTTPRHLRRRGVIVHRGTVPRSAMRTIKGVPTTTPVETLIALGSVVDVGRLEAAVDSALVGGHVTVDYVQRKLDEAGRRWGIAPLKSLLAERSRRPPTESELERLYDRRVTQAFRLPAPRFQFEVPDASPRRRIDFAYPHILLGVEALGWREHGKFYNWNRDWQRHNQLSSLGWEMLYYTWLDVMKHPDRIAREVKGAIERRSHSLF